MPCPAIPFKASFVLGHKTKESVDGGSFLRVSRIVRIEGFGGALARLARRVLTGIEVRQAELWARAGLDDPADTGLLFAYIFLTKATIQAALPVGIDIEPNFTGALFRLRGQGEFRVVPARILGPAFAFAMSPATVRALWSARA